MKTITLTFALLLSFAAHAAGPWIEAGPTYSVYGGTDLEPSAGGQLKLGYGPFYAWGSYEYPKFWILGQPMGTLRLPGFGLGGRTELIDGFDVFAEVGYYMPSRNKPGAEDEIVDQVLVNNHGSGVSRNLTSFEHHLYEIDNGIGLTFGGAYEAKLSRSATLSLSVAYRLLSVQERFIEWNGPVRDEQCGIEGKTCWWQHFDQRDLSAVRFGLAFSWRF